jgi:hypothetical protein
MWLLLEPHTQPETADQIPWLSSGTRHPVSVPDPRRKFTRPWTPCSPPPTSAYPHPGTSAASERDRGTLHRHPAPRMPRRPPDHRTATSPPCYASTSHTTKHAPPAPIARSAPARRPHSRARARHSATATRPTRRTRTRVRARHNVAGFSAATAVTSSSAAFANRRRSWPLISPRAQRRAGQASRYLSGATGWAPVMARMAEIWG